MKSIMEKGLHFLYKGIDVIFTDQANALVGGTEEARIIALEAFFEGTPLNSIKWVTQKETEGGGDEYLPMYHMTNMNDETLLFWPLLDVDKSNMILIVEDHKERQDVEIDKGYEPRE